MHNDVRLTAQSTLLSTMILPKIWELARRGYSLLHGDTTDDRESTSSFVSTEVCCRIPEQPKECVAVHTLTVLRWVTNDAILYCITSSEHGYQ